MYRYSTMKYRAKQVNTKQYNTKQYHAIPNSTNQYHTMPCNTVQYHARNIDHHEIQCNTMNIEYTGTMLSCWDLCSWFLRLIMLVWHHYSKICVLISFRNKGWKDISSGWWRPSHVWLPICLQFQSLQLQLTGKFEIMKNVFILWTNVGWDIAYLYILWAVNFGITKLMFYLKQTPLCLFQEMLGFKK